MPTRSILARVALLTGLLIGLVALADGIAQHELQKATGDVAAVSAVADAQPAGAHDDE